MAPKRVASPSPSSSAESATKLSRTETRSQTQAMINLVSAIDSGISQKSTANQLESGPPIAVGLSSEASFSTPISQTTMNIPEPVAMASPAAVESPFSTVPNTVNFASSSAKTTAPAALGAPPANPAVIPAGTGISIPTGNGIPIPTVNDLLYGSARQIPPAALGAPPASIYGQFGGGVTSQMSTETAPGPVSMGVYTIPTVNTRNVLSMPAPYSSSVNYQEFSSRPITSAIVSTPAYASLGAPPSTMNFQGARVNYSNMGGIAASSVANPSSNMTLGFQSVQRQQQAPAPYVRSVSVNNAVSHGQIQQHQLAQIPAPSGASYPGLVTSSVFVPSNQSTGIQQQQPGSVVVQNSPYVQQGVRQPQENNSGFSGNAASGGENLIHYEVNNVPVLGNNMHASMYGPMHSICEPIGADLPSPVISKIINSEFIDFGILLDKTSLDRECNGGRLFSVEKGNVVWLENKAKPVIEDIEEWTDAFLVFSSVYLSAHPSRVLELLKYAAIVRDAAARFYGWGWRIYDVQFRHRQQRAPTRSWAILDGELWQVQVGSQPIRPANASKHSNRQGSGPNVNQGGRGRGRGRGQYNKGPRREQYCFRFNSPSPCTRKPCQYTHKCSRCGQSNHSVMSCSLKK